MTTVHAFYVITHVAKDPAEQATFETADGRLIGFVPRATVLKAIIDMGVKEGVEQVVNGEVVVVDTDAAQVVDTDAAQVVDTDAAQLVDTDIKASRVISNGHATACTSHLVAHFQYDRAANALRFRADPESTVESRSMAMQRLLEHWRDTERFACLRGWRAEMYPVFVGMTTGTNEEVHDEDAGASVSASASARNKSNPDECDNDGRLYFEMERAGVGLFGVRRYGCHLNGYVRGDEGSGTLPLRMWIARRSHRKQTYPGMLDNMVGGGLSLHRISPHDNMLKEAAEEAGLTTTHHANLLQNMHAVGTISFFLDAGPAKGYVPETEFLYDIALPSTFTPTPQDGEVESFHLWDMPTIRGKLHEFTPESALVVVDFMIRHGLVTAESERDYVEVVRLLQHDLCGLPGP